MILSRHPTVLSHLYVITTAVAQGFARYHAKIDASLRLEFTVRIRLLVASARARKHLPSDVVRLAYRVQFLLRRRPTLGCARTRSPLHAVHGPRAADISRLTHVARRAAPTAGTSFALIPLHRATGAIVRMWRRQRHRHRAVRARRVVDGECVRALRANVRDRAVDLARACMPRASRERARVEGCPRAGVSG